MRFQHHITLLLGRMETRRLVELDAGAKCLCVWGCSGVGRVKCSRQATPLSWRRPRQAGGCGGRGVESLHWRKAAEEGDWASLAGASVAGLVGACDGA